MRIIKPFGEANPPARPDAAEPVKPVSETGDRPAHPDERISDDEVPGCEPVYGPEYWPDGKIKVPPAVTFSDLSRE